MSFLFIQGFFQDSNDDLEVFQTDGMWKPGLIGTKVNFETTLELETQESDEVSLSLLISTSLSMNAQKELNWSESCLFVSGITSSITLLFGGPKFYT